MTTASTNSTIETVMTPNPIRVGGGAPASELAILLEENEISGVPVVDGKDRVIGVISRTDVLRRCVEGPLGSTRGSWLSSVTSGMSFDTEPMGVVSEFMNPDPVTARRDDSISAVARRMTDEKVHRIIVVDEEKCVVGIVTSIDMIKLLR